MTDIKIRTVLDIKPAPKKHEILVITRGATASINFDLFNKVYHMDNIDQMTFTFRQGKDIWYYNLIDYFKPTADRIARTDTCYYERLEANLPDVAPYKFIPKAIVPGESCIGLFEKLSLADEIAQNENWQFGENFQYYYGNTFEYINFILYSTDTKQFKLTAPGHNMEFEVTTRLNTDQVAGMHSKDSIIITPQHPIAVVDSLYSKIN